MISRISGVFAAATLAATMTLSPLSALAQDAKPAEAAASAMVDAAASSAVPVVVDAAASAAEAPSSA